MWTDEVAVRRRASKETAANLFQLSAKWTNTQHSRMSLRHHFPYETGTSGCPVILYSYHFVEKNIKNNPCNFFRCPSNTSFTLRRVSKHSREQYKILTHSLQAKNSQKRTLFLLGINVYCILHFCLFSKQLAKKLTRSRYSVDNDICNGPMIKFLRNNQLTDQSICTQKSHS